MLCTDEGTVAVELSGDTVAGHGNARSYIRPASAATCRRVECTVGRSAAPRRRLTRTTGSSPTKVPAAASMRPRGDKLSSSWRSIIEQLPAGPKARVWMRSKGISDQTRFCWIGGTGEDEPFYYRIQSPVTMIEFDHQSGVSSPTPPPSGSTSTPHAHTQRQRLRHGPHPPILRGPPTLAGRTRSKPITAQSR